MNKISVYHVAPGRMYRVLPILLRKIVHLGMRVLIYTQTVEEQLLLDKNLWTFSSDAFLPHGTQDDPYPESQPILLTTELRNENLAQVLCLFCKNWNNFADIMRSIELDFLSSISTLLFMFEDDKDTCIEYRHKLSKLVLTMQISDLEQIYYVEIDGLWKKIETAETS